MASPSASQVSLDDILEYTSNNEVLTPAEQAQQLCELEEPIPADLADQLFTPEAPAPAAINPYVGQVPNTYLYAISKAELSSRAGLQYVPLPLPTPAMLEAAARSDISELIPQDHPEWQNLRSGKVTGSSLAEILGLFEPLAGRALVQAGVHSKMRDSAKLQAKVASLQNPRQAAAEVDPQTQVYFDWGHRHEACGIVSYIHAHRQRTVHEIGFVLLDPSLKTLPPEVRQGIDPATLPVIGSSPDGIITEHPTTVINRPRQHWRQYPPSMRRVLEIKAKTPFRPNVGQGTWTWLGKSCKPYTRILPQYFAQAQLNMMVTDSASCHLLCYTVRGGSAEFTIPLHKAWCNQMLHWLSELNTQYIVKGLAPPENVFWDQEAYRAFVALTKKACQSLDNSGVAVQSHHSTQSAPLFCAVGTEDVVPNTPETGQASQQQQQRQLQRPAGWQFLPQQQQEHQQPEHQQQQQQPQQQTAILVPAACFSMAQAMPASVASLQLLSAAAIPLPDQDTDMPDAVAEPQGPLQQPQGQQPQQQQLPGQQPKALQPQQPESSGPIGHHRLVSWMQHILQKHCVDLRHLLDSTCQSALSLLATSDVIKALERIARDVKAGWPDNPSALVMHRIRHFRASPPPVNTPGAAQNGPGAAADSPGRSTTGPGADARGDEAFPAGLGAGARSPGRVDAIPQAPAQAPNAGVPAHAEIQTPVMKTNLPARAFNTAATGQPDSLMMPPATAAAFVNSVAGAAPCTWQALTASASARISPSRGPITQDRHQAVHQTPVQRQLWPDSGSDSANPPVLVELFAGSTAADPIDLNTVPNTPLQAATGNEGVPVDAATFGANNTGVPFNATALSTTLVNAAVGCAAQRPALEPSTDASREAKFGSRPFPANMSEVIRYRLLEATAMHSADLSPDDFDATILIRLAHMPEWKALKVLQRVADTYWPGIENNTRFLMSICCSMHKL